MAVVRPFGKSEGVDRRSKPIWKFRNFGACYRRIVGKKDMVGIADDTRVMKLSVMLNKDSAEKMK